MTRPALLLVTDLLYPAAGRRYGDEDAWLAGQLRREFTVALAPLADAAALLDRFPLALVRNCGPVMLQPSAWEDFRERAAEGGARVVNDLTGRGDMRGKHHLRELFAAGEPVIPTAGSPEELAALPPADRWLVKPLLGADSLGQSVVDTPPERFDGLLVQPYVDIDHEVSFVFVDRSFHYALRTGAARWELERYEPSPEDLAFAQRFVDWNAVDHGVQRVDGCRTRDGRLLLVELEDLNPYLSLDRLDDAARERFVDSLLLSLHAALDR